MALTPAPPPSFVPMTCPFKPPDTAHPALRWLGLTGLALLLSGCASLRSPEPAAADTALPTAWTAAPASATASPADLARWWTRFEDPTLTTLVEQALLSNTSVQSAQAALAQARAQRDVQAAQLGPSLGASASARRSRAGGQDASNNFQAGFDASWEPDIFGGNRSAANASEADASAAASNLANVQVSLAAEVAVNLIALRGLQTRLAIARSNLAAQTETLQITRWRAQAGLAASLDVEQAVAASEQTAAQLPALQSGISQAINALAVLTGEAPGTLQKQLSAASPIPLAPAELALAFPTETLRQRPDVRSAESRVSAALARVAVADAARELYEGSPTVVVRDAGTHPDTLWVRGSNRAHVSYHVDERTGRVIAQAAIDNLVKGAAGQAQVGVVVEEEPPAAKAGAVATIPAETKAALNNLKYFISKA